MKGTGILRIVIMPATMPLTLCQFYRSLEETCESRTFKTLPGIAVKTLRAIIYRRPMPRPSKNLNALVYPPFRHVDSSKPPI